MAARRCALGIDFGTESGRAVLVDVASGEELATSVYRYAHGVIDEVLPDGETRLPPGWALQDPADYLRTLTEAIPDVLRQAGVGPAEVVGLGIAFTACTILPIDAAGEPLCAHERFAGNPHAWVKLWKHHAAQPEADIVNAVARQRGEAFLERYGGRVSAEWLVPKVLQVLREASEVYAAADRFIEAGDWVVLRLTGQERRSACAAGYKALYEKGTGYPSPDYFAALDPRLRNLVAEKLSTDIYPLGQRAGGLTTAMAAATGLLPGTAVAVAGIDAHLAVPACTVVRPGQLVMVMGTSTCHMLLSAERRAVSGVAGVVEDGILPGYFGYEAGQSGVGDIFAWYVERCVPPAYRAEAEARGLSLYQLLDEKAARLRPGQAGLIALDWWNGNRSVLMDADLSGVLVGATINTKPEEVYRALIEGTAFGTNVVVRNFVDHGLAVDELYACGGLPEQNRLLTQIYADVTGREIRVSASAQTAALGSAMLGAVAAGEAAGGHRDVAEAARRMARLKPTVYRPDPEAGAVYARLYAEYLRLHDYFGRGGNDVMRRLKAIRDEVSA